jgi:hypothetical protein
MTTDLGRQDFNRLQIIIVPKSQSGKPALAQGGCRSGLRRGAGGRSRKRAHQDNDQRDADSLRTISIFNLFESRTLLALTSYC